MDSLVRHQVTHLEHKTFGRQLCQPGIPVLLYLGDVVRNEIRDHLKGCRGTGEPVNLGDGATDGQEHIHPRPLQAAHHPITEQDACPFHPAVMMRRAIQTLANARTLAQLDIAIHEPHLRADDLTIMHRHDELGPAPGLERQKRMNHPVVCVDDLGTLHLNDSPQGHQHARVGHRRRVLAIVVEQPRQMLQGAANAVDARSPIHLKFRQAGVPQRCHRHLVTTRDERVREAGNVTFDSPADGGIELCDHQDAHRSHLSTMSSTV